MPNDNPSNEFALTNIDPNRVAEALAALTINRSTVGLKMNEVKKARQTMKRAEEYFEQEHGIDAKAIRARYEESKMTPRERERKYVTEQVTRRALSLWSAESEEDFEALMAAAVETQAASGDSAMKLDAAQARAAGLIAGMNGASPTTDNPHVPGSMQHQEWALGCADGVGEDRETPPVPAAPPKPRGRPRKKSASELLAENAAKLGAEAAPPLFGDAEEEMPAVGALPE